MNKPTAKDILGKYDAGYQFNQSIKLYDTVQVNENFFIGNQWEGVISNGLPTPVFNFLKQVVNFQVATITSENITLKASPMPGIGTKPIREVERVCKVLNDQYAAIIERNNLVVKIREFLRNAAVDGDGCLYSYFDPSVKNGQEVPGEIMIEAVDNTRVIFGNPNCRDAQKQPYIIISKRMMVDEAQEVAKEHRENGTTDIENPEDIQPDSEIFQNKYDSYTDDKVTVCMYWYKNRETGTIWYAEATSAGLLTKPTDTYMHLYPIQWLSWDFVHDCYHGQAMVTGLIPNQKFVNKMFALVGISLTTQAFPKTVYDKTKIKNWDGSVGSAVGVNGNVEGVAKTIQGAAVNPQIHEFMDFCMGQTKSLLGASDVALGDSRPDNTSAIIALQRAANTPTEMTKQNLYQCIDSFGPIWNDMMAAKYGTRLVGMELDRDPNQPMPLGMTPPEGKYLVPFDFSVLNEYAIAVKHDAGASSYWSEIASMQTIENLLMNHQIDVLQFLERVPSGYITEKQKLIDEIKSRAMPMAPPSTGTGTSMETDISSIPINPGQGNGQLQRALNKTGV